MDIKIEKNIPIPVHHHAHGKYVNVINQMEIGDSVTVENLKTRNSFYQCMKRKGYKAVTRRITDQGYGAYRIWRTE